MAGNSAHPVRQDEHSGQVEHSGHRHERPEDWGWHAEAGGWSRGFAIAVGIIMILMFTTTHERHIAQIWLAGITALILVVLFWDRRRRKNAWRE